MVLFSQKLARLLNKSITKGRFILTSGKSSSYYLNARKVTLTPEGAYLATQLVFKIIKENRIKAVGGPTVGADPILGSLAYLAYLEKYPLKTFIIRKHAKNHADKKQIEGPSLNKRDQILLIDDTTTTGKSLIESAQVLRSRGFKVHKAASLIDRNEGAKENLANIGIEFSSVFTIKNFKICE